VNLPAGTAGFAEVDDVAFAQRRMFAVAQQRAAQQRAVAALVMQFPPSVPEVDGRMDTRDVVARNDSVAACFVSPENMRRPQQAELPGLVVL
jgi:hypothetical protein